MISFCNVMFSFVESLVFRLIFSGAFFSVLSGEGEIISFSIFYRRVQSTSKKGVTDETRGGTIGLVFRLLAKAELWNNSCQFSSGCEPEKNCK